MTTASKETVILETHDEAQLQATEELSSDFMGIIDKFYNSKHNFPFEKMVNVLEHAISNQITSSLLKLSPKEEWALFLLQKMEDAAQQALKEGFEKEYPFTKEAHPMVSKKPKGKPKNANLIIQDLNKKFDIAIQGMLTSYASELNGMEKSETIIIAMTEMLTNAIVDTAVRVGPTLTLSVASKLATRSFAGIRKNLYTAYNGSVMN